ncbi:MAG: RHS repeat-associated core domain-containing protein, partial [Humidesulfovibrio sp.]|uniref:RHS repeat-associated core domain-containing protein n=1 Tax=Humidesulfovibrio sp. TaxID=2910988 RepID=UPI0027FCAF47
GFAGGLFDADTGLTRFVWRDYDADTGRFTALDPLGKKGGDSDWYGYCVDDPVNRVDVWGLEWEWDWSKSAGGRIVASGVQGMATGAITGAGAGVAAGGVGAISGAIAGAGVGLPVGLLKGVGTEIYTQYFGDSISDKAKEISDSMMEQTKALQDWYSRK